MAQRGGDIYGGKGVTTNRPTCSPQADGDPGCTKEGAHRLPPAVESGRGNEGKACVGAVEACQAPIARLHR